MSNSDSDLDLNSVSLKLDHCMSKSSETIRLSIDNNQNEAKHQGISSHGGKSNTEKESKKIHKHARSYSDTDISHTSEPKSTKISPTTQPNKSPSETIIETDIPVLLEQLANHAAKWKEIGFGLGFSNSELDVIASKPKLFMNAPNSWLTEMLSMWVQWNPQTQHGKYATLQDLVKALRSKIVGLALVAEELKKAIKDCHRIQDQSQEAYQKHLTVELMPPDLSAPAIEHYAYYLRSYFTSTKVRTGKWPEIEAKEYIRLAVIESNESHCVDLTKFREATIHGSIDDILESKAPIEFSELLKPNIIMGKKYPIRRLLVEGAPGIGKSTMSWEICHKWGNGELFQEYFLVIMLRFRDSWVQNVKCLSDMFRYSSEPEMQQQITKQIVRTQGQGVLFILEGFDEAPFSLMDTNSLFFELFEGSILPNATVMLTTRPHVVVRYQLRRCCKGESSRRIEVLGFGKAEINHYIEAHFNRSTSQVQDFHKYLELYPYIYSIMYVPLNSAIVTHVYQMCKSNSVVVPKTMTQLYTSLVKTLLLRYLKDKQEFKDVHINDFSDLPQPVLTRFHQVCQLAYDGIIESVKQIIFSDLPQDFDSLGLMQSVSELYIDKGASISHNFLHLTIQEFLAAYHLSTLSEEEQLIKLMHLAHDKLNVPPILKFLAGLCGKSLQSPVCKALVGSKQSTTWSISLPELHLCFEIHAPSVLSNIFGFCENIFFSTENSYHPGRYKRFYHPISPSYHSQRIRLSVLNFYVLGYCILFSDSKWEIRLKGQREFELFLEGLLMHHLDKLQDQSLLSGLIKLVSTFVNCNQLAKYMHLFPKLEEAHFTSWNYNNVDQKNSTESVGTNNSGLSELLNCLPNSLTSLSLPTLRDLSEADCIALTDLLASSNYNLKYLKINADIDEERIGSGSRKEHFNKQKVALPIAVCHIIDGISRNTMSSLQELYMRHSTLDASCIARLTTLLRANISITALDISCCKLANRTSDIGELAESLVSNSILQFLSLSAVCKNHNIGDSETKNVTSVGIRIQSENQERSVDSVRIGESFISNTGASVHADPLRRLLLRNQTLVNLKLAYCDLHSQDIVLLAEGLKFNSTLERLDLKYNSASEIGATAVAKALERNTVLKSLDIESNRIGDKGTIAFAKMLENNSAIQFLNLRGILLEDEGAIALANSVYNSNWNPKYEPKYEDRISFGYNESIHKMYTPPYVSSVPCSGYGINLHLDTSKGVYGVGIQKCPLNLLSTRDHPSFDDSANRSCLLDRVVSNTPLIQEYDLSHFTGGYIITHNHSLLTVNKAELLLDKDVIQKIALAKPRPIYFVQPKI